MKGYEHRETDRQRAANDGHEVSSDVSYILGASIFRVPYLRLLFEQKQTLKFNRVFKYRATLIPGAISPGLMNFVRYGPIFLSPQY